MSKIIKFPGKKPGQTPDFNDAGRNMFDVVEAMLKVIPDPDLSARMSRMIREKLGRLLAYVEIARHAREIIAAAGYAPNDFAPDRDSFEDFLIMDAEDYPVDEMEDPDNMLNGPYFDWRQEDDLIRAATTVGFDDENPAKIAFNILSLHRGDTHWKALINGAWYDGPEVDEFGFDPFDDDWDDEDVWDDDEDEDDEDVWDDDEDEDEDDGDEDDE